MLRKKAVPLRTIADALSREDEPEQASNALRVVMSRVKPKLEPILDPTQSLISNTSYGYHINPYYNLITDLDEFEQILKTAFKQKDIRPRIDELKKAVKLYRDPVYKEASIEHWQISVREYYAVRYLKAARQLLIDLAELEYNRAKEVSPSSGRGFFFALAEYKQLSMKTIRINCPGSIIFTRL